MFVKFNFFSYFRNYDEDFEDEEEVAFGPVAIEASSNKRLGFGSGNSSVSPPQRLGSKTVD